MESPYEFGQRVRRLRQSRGMSVYRLAKLTGLSERAIVLIERGQRRPLLETAELLARALGGPQPVSTVRPPDSGAEGASSA